MMTRPPATSSPRQVSIGGTLVGAAAPIFVIAEIGNTHEGSFGQAQALMTAAAESGAHAVKLQTHLAEAETVEGAPFPPYFRPVEARRAYFDRIAFDESQYRDLSQLAASLGVVLLSSPFSAEAVDVLDSVGISAYKVPSGEVTNLPYRATSGAWLPSSARAPCAENRSRSSATGAKLATSCTSTICWRRYTVVSADQTSLVSSRWDVALAFQFLTSPE